MKTFARRILKPPLHKVEVNHPYTVFGSTYGGWPIINGELDSTTTILSIGLGEDISFDLAVIKEFDCSVAGFDPTPKSLAWLQQQSLPTTFTFYPVGIASKDGIAEFYAPKNPEHVSFSSTPTLGKEGQIPVRAEVMRLETLLKKFDLPIPDVLKMDIEGFEYDVIVDILKGEIRPKQMLIEFHHNIYSDYGKTHTQDAVKMLHDAGYRIFYVSSGGHEYGFLHSA